MTRANLHGYATGGHTGPNRPDKGLLRGACNVTACQRPSATWFNHSTRAYYCFPCAQVLNEANRADSFTIGLGHELCTPTEKFS